MFLRWKPMNAKLRKERTHYERFLHLLTVKSLTPPNSPSLQMEAAVVPVKKILVCWIRCWICPEPFQFAFDCYTTNGSNLMTSFSTFPKFLKWTVLIVHVRMKWGHMGHVGVELFFFSLMYKESKIEERFFFLDR